VEGDLAKERKGKGDSLGGVPPPNSGVFSIGRGVAIDSEGERILSG